jgi:hypothetical protein
MMSYTYYGTLVGANSYFDQRLHSDSWNDSATTDRPKALQEATRIIDNLNYKGVKHALWSIMYEYDSTNECYKKLIGTDAPSRDEMIAADATQALEFPRGQDTLTPSEIEWACYEIALALIEGFDPEDAAERINVIRQGYSAVSTTYDNSSAMAEYLVYGIPTARVWQWLKPYLTDGRIIRLSRAD